MLFAFILQVKTKKELSFDFKKTYSTPISNIFFFLPENCGGTGKGGYRKLQPADAKDSTVGIKKFFNALDKDRNGYIEVGDLATRIVKSGMTPEEDNTENNIKSACHTS